MLEEEIPCSAMRSSGPVPGSRYGNRRLLDARVRSQPVDGAARGGLQVAVAQQKFCQRELGVHVGYRKLHERRGGRPVHDLRFDAPPRRPSNRLGRHCPCSGQFRPQRGVFGDDTLVRGCNFGLRTGDRSDLSDGFRVLQIRIDGCDDDASFDGDEVDPDQRDTRPTRR